jgi:hypothetical protein
VTPIDDREFDRLLAGVKRESLHLEMRDAYGTLTELPHMAKWAAGEPDDDDWLQGWCDVLRRGRAAGTAYRRARIVSEPLSDYQRWSFSIAQPMVDAGEDIRWVPRSRVSSVALPGNDFYLLDGELIVFLLYAGSGTGRAKLSSTDPANIELCRSAFNAVWPLAVPHREYQPL